MAAPVPHELQFQSTLPRGSDSDVAITSAGLLLFQSTLPRGSDILTDVRFKKLNISIHAPSRERRIVEGLQSCSSLFQSTLPRGSDIAPLDCYSTAGGYFNPRSLAGATYYNSIKCIKIQISIHAPSRERRPAGWRYCSHPYHFNPRSLAGATSSWRFQDSGYKISIHAPSRERRCPRGCPFCIVAFQSTLPRGSDKMSYVNNNATYISIHAPSRERQRQD